MPNIIEILKKIMLSYDFIIQEEFTDYFLAEKDNTSLACVVLPSDEDIKFADILAKKKKLPRDLDKIIMATPMDIHPELEDWVSQEGILLWDKKKLEEEIGRAVLSGAEGDLLEKGQIDEFPAESQVPVKKEDIPKVIMPPTMKEVEVKIESKDIPQEKESIVKPQITMSDVSEISKRIVQGFRFDLELVPYYLFDYSCELIVEGRTTPQVSSGTLAINGLTNHAESWDFEFDTVSEVETSHTKLEPKFDENKAFATAKESAISLNTREIQTVDDRGAVTIYEKKKVRPKEGAIDIQKRGLVYLPVWCVEGSNGVMIINATTGKVIREDIYRESDDVLPRSESRGFSF